MRILFVNWVDDADPLRRGGGVAVYQHNLVRALSEREDVEVSVLSSGLAQGLVSRRPHVARLPTHLATEKERVKRWALVNSGTLAPSHADFGHAAQLEHPATEAAYAAFLSRTGPYDVIHYNNLEGLPATVLRAGARVSQARQILSLHNYYPFCPQVNLWFAEHRTCTDFRGGTRCVGCLPVRPAREVVRGAYRMEWLLARLGLGPGSRYYDSFYRSVLRAGWRSLKRARQGARWLRRGGRPLPAPEEVPPVEPPVALSAPPPLQARSALPAGPEPDQQPDPQTRREGEGFAARRLAMVELINRHCDSLLCVSDRVRQIALGHGIAPALARTCYIGSPHAALWRESQPRGGFLDAEGRLRLAYLGYMRRDKGFHFLMEALLALPAPVAARLHLTLGAQRGGPEEMALVEAVAGHLGGLVHHDGYSHAELDDILAEVTLGLVPVMWEDNLPQVAIEMHARHIPLLTSDLGGAQELGRCPALRFRAGDAADFATRIASLLAGDVDAAAYWAGAMPPTGMEAHLAELWSVYRGESARESA